MSNISTSMPILAVREISTLLREVVETAFAQVRVRGELSGCKRAASGHWYFSLKDSDAVLDGVCWRGTAASLGMMLEDGLEVVCTGRLTVYAGRSRYQMVGEHIQPAGQGALLALLEKRKADLAAEGLFAAERKRALPFLPKVIGVITSPTGAVIQDILHRLKDRFPCHVIVWPVAVQGEIAAAQITQALESFAQCIPKPDVVIVARGGGSVEDLWCFNEENVVRAIANSPIPVISAVGHETDTTLADFAADYRAPTPTAAAEIVMPVRQHLYHQVQDMAARLHNCMLLYLQHKQKNMQHIHKQLRHPRQIIEQKQQKLDDVIFRLENAVSIRMKQNQQNIKGLSQLLESLSYHSVLQRGFALIKNTENQIIPNKSIASDMKNLTISFYDGELYVTNNDKK